MSETVVVLPARLEWAESFRLCVDQVSREKKYFLMTEAPPLNQVREFLTKLNAAGHPSFFALKGDRVVGWCTVRRAETPARAHVGELSMGIRLEERSKGLGKKLVEACLRECRLLGYHKIELTVFTDNAHAIRLYEATGFETEGHLRAFAKLQDSYKDAYLMGQFL